MSAALPSSEQDAVTHAQSSADAAGAITANTHDTDNDEDEEDEEDEEADEEPKLKYAKLTGSLASVYRNGDSTSAFTVGGDKMVLGSHNGNIHVLSLPELKSLRTYHAHSATITSVSISPTPPPPAIVRVEQSNTATSTGLLSPPPSVRAQQTNNTSSSRTPSRQQNVPIPIPNTPSNQIYIATSSLDGHVCISSLIDAKDVQLRNFARPVSAVALSPDYKRDRTYLSGGLAGQLILTVGGKAGTTTDANTNSTAAAATSGFLGAFGLAGDRGKDTILHSGEGSISTIKWSRTGKWVVWVNEEGIKIMRSHLKLGSEDEEDAWRRIAHAAKPNRRGWEENMASVWKGRAEWVGEKELEADDDEADVGENGTVVVNGTDHKNHVTPDKKTSKKKRMEKLVVGWGDTAWILHVHEGGTNAAGKKQIGSAEIERKLVLPDTVISGITLYTPSLLAILAYRTSDENENAAQDKPSPRKGRHNRQTGLEPQLRLVKVVSGEEDEIDELPISRFETLASQDYHLGTIFIPLPPPTATIQKAAAAGEKGALEGLWDATTAGSKYATRMFSSSAASVLSGSSGKDDSIVATSPPPSTKEVPAAAGVVVKKREDVAHPYFTQPGLKLFIHSPYDCILAVKRDKSDHLDFLLRQEEYSKAWKLLDEHPSIASAGREKQDEIGSPRPGSARSSNGKGSLADFFQDERSIHSTSALENSAAEREKRRIGDLWLHQLVSADHWAEAGRVAGKVLGTSSTRWEHWVWTFAQANKFDEITPYIPSSPEIRLPGMVYEVVLGHYIHADPRRLRDLLDDWEPEHGLYDIRSVSSAVEARLDDSNGEVQKGSEDWRILMDCLAKLYIADGRAQEALRCYIQAQNADAAFALIKEEKLMDVIAAEDVPGLLMLRISKEQMRDAPLSELEDLSREAVKLLTEEALRGTVMPSAVINQLEGKGKRSFRPFLFFYMRTLWQAASDREEDAPRLPVRRSRFAIADRRAAEGRALVEDHADLAVELFVEYDRDLLMEFLRASEVYSYEKAAALCEQRDYIPELVYVLSKTGQLKRALFLIIDKLGDVSQAIAFAKENPDLWDDLLDYSMDKPAFIRGLLEEVGTAIDPIQLVRRIPEGLEIEGLQKGIERMMHEYDIQFSISEGVARVLEGEVQMGMDTLRAGQKKGVKFDIVHEDADEVEITASDPPTQPDGGEALPVPQRKVEKQDTKNVKPGYCAGCGDIFHEDEKEFLLGFACGHVYHLSCLLKANPETSDPKTIQRLLNQLGAGDNASSTDEGYSGRSVGAKVAHAQIIKNVVRAGCRVCIIRDGA